MSALIPASDSSEEITRSQSSPQQLAHSDVSAAPWFTPLDWCYGQTDVGRVREANEDNYLCDPQRKLFIVADGMGGHAAGEEASRIAIEQISNALTLGVLLHSANEQALTDELVQALNTSNAEVIRQGQSNAAWREMGTTAVVAILRHRSLHITSIGDSRAYLLRGETLWQLSRDHSVAASLVEQGFITADQVRTHPMRNRLTACLGIETQIVPDTNCIALEPDDRILLCSDGLWDMVEDEAIARLLYLSETPHAATDALIEAANESGGKDNITAVVLHIRPEILSDPLANSENHIFSVEELPNEDTNSASSEDTVVHLQ